MDLRTQYMGLTLKNPIVPSASPLSRSLDTIRRMEDAGAAAIVIYSLFEEQVNLESNQLDHYLSYFTEAFAEALTWHPSMKDYRTGTEEYLNLIRKAKEAVEIPVIGSLNGISPGGWTSYAKKIEEVGADGLELNVYYLAGDPKVDGQTVEEMIRSIVSEVRGHTSLPLAVKLGPYFSSMARTAQELCDAGADALVCFNRFFQPDLDLQHLRVTPNLVLSTSEELRLPLRWVALLSDIIAADFAITSGVHTHRDVLKGLMVGAKVTMMASELLTNGVDRIGEILVEMERWMEQREYESVAQMQGSMSVEKVDEPAAFGRANYMAVLQSWQEDPAGRLFRDVLGGPVA